MSFDQDLNPNYGTTVGRREVTLSELRKYNIERQKEWDQGEVLTEEYFGNAIAGEVGEACNIVKKLARERLGLRGSKATSVDLGKELADIIIYIDLLAAMYNIDLSVYVRGKFNETSIKYKLTTIIP